MLGAGGPADADRNVLEGIVRGRVFLGENTEFLVDVDGMEVRVRASGAVPRVDADDRVTLTFPVEGCHVFARERLDGDDVELELPRSPSMSKAEAARRAGRGGAPEPATPRSGSGPGATRPR